MNGNVSEWLGAVEGLADVHARLRRVAIENRSALEVIRREDTPGTLFYLDPPYLHETRANADAYAFEMTEADHRDLLKVIQTCKGKVMLSAIRPPLRRALIGWARHTFDLPNNAAGGQAKERATEVVWQLDAGR
jgi:DNA adenine methylase